jgi:hypothetical protein
MKNSYLRSLTEVQPVKPTKWFRDGDGYPQTALERILGCLKRVDSPIYMGHISVEIGFSLAQTQAMLEHLEEKGLVRNLTVDELKQQRFDVRANIWVLVKL